MVRRIHLRSKRRSIGISAVVSSTILSAVVVTLGLATWAYTTSLAASTATDYGRNTNSAILQQQTQLSVMHGYFFQANKTLQLYLYNSGDVPLIVWRVTISDEPSTFTVSPTSGENILGRSNMIGKASIGSSPYFADLTASGLNTSAGTTLTVTIYSLAQPLYGGYSRPDLNSHWGVFIVYRLKT